MMSLPLLFSGPLNGFAVTFGGVLLGGNLMAMNEAVKGENVERSNKHGRELNDDLLTFRAKVTGR